MRSRFVAVFLVCFLVFSGSCAGVKKDAIDVSLWELWQAGELERAGKLAAEWVAAKRRVDEGLHVLVLKAFLEGRYREALLNYQKIDAGYPAYERLDFTVVHAYLHLKEYDRALRFGIARKLKNYELKRLKGLKVHPLRVRLERNVILPFVEEPAAAYFPGFEATVNGRTVLVNVDTGAGFLQMAPEMAQELGIELSPFGEQRWVGGIAKTYFGIAKSFQLGDAVLENTPVVGLESLRGRGYVIFGTNVLQQFFVTLDYPNKRLILSPRDDDDLKTAHLALVPERRVRVPFYLGGDHFMFVRGALGEYARLNFFIDSGLLKLRPDENGVLRQAAFSTTATLYESFGFDPAKIRTKWMRSHLPLALGSSIVGSLAQEGLYLTVSDFAYGPYEEVEMHGQLSHAFLKKYAWTIDFEERSYSFSL